MDVNFKFHNPNFEEKKKCLLRWFLGRRFKIGILASYLYHISEREILMLAPEISEWYNLIIHETFWSSRQINERKKGKNAEICILWTDERDIFIRIYLLFARWQ